MTRPPRLHRALAGLLALALCGGAAAQGPVAAVPYYTPDHFMQGLHRDLTAPAAAAFSKQSARMEPAVRTLCMADSGAASKAALAEARQRWGDAMRAWEGLAALAVGPLIERRSLLHIDFTPTRPALIARAAAQQPAGAAAMEKIGTPAKGLPALEWLLWTEPVAPRSPACAYAAEVAADVAREAQALAQAFEAAAARDWSEDGEAASAAMAEAINQWLAGLERLRWRDIERPLRAAEDGGSGRSAPPFPRAASGQSAASWAAQWQALRRVAVQADKAPVPEPGQGLVAIETYLRGRGLNGEADALRRAVRGADAAMQHKLSPAAPARLLAATKALSDLKRVLEERVAPALQVSIGFSSADGD